MIFLAILGPLFGVTMPVCPISLNNKVAGGKGKIRKKWANVILGHKGDLEVNELGLQCSFDPACMRELTRYPSANATTGAKAKLLDLGGLDLYCLAAHFARSGDEAI